MKRKKQALSQLILAGSSLLLYLSLTIGFAEAQPANSLSAEDRKEIENLVQSELQSFFDQSKFWLGLGVPLVGTLVVLYFYKVTNDTKKIIKDEMALPLVR